MNMNTNIDPELRTALERVIDYMFDDEMEDFDSSLRKRDTEYADIHIFHAIAVIHGRLNGHRLSAREFVQQQAGAD